MKTALTISLILAGQAAPSLAGEKETEHAFERCCSNTRENHQEFQSQLENLRMRLKLTTEQEPLWNTWSVQIQKAHQVMEDFKGEEDARRGLPAPERQEKWMTAMDVHLLKMRDSLSALKSLYGALLEGQKKTFDAEVPFKRTGR